MHIKFKRKSGFMWMTTKAWDVASKHIVEWILATSFILQKRMIHNITFEDSITSLDGPAQHTRSTT